MMDLMEAAQATGGYAAHGNPVFCGVSTDSRSLGAGELFVALTGPNYDGHAFVADAIERGAAAVMASQAWVDREHPVLPLLAVADTRLALGALAADWRARFDLPLIGVTGSNGKTTVKEMCAAILRAQASAQGQDGALTVLATAGNLNNDIGVPLMLARLRHSHRSAVIEMGMNRPGEIAYLAEMARPTVAVVTNAQRAHLEGMGTVADVAREKGAIYDALGDGGCAVISADDPFAASWRSRNAGRRILSFGVSEGADICARCVGSGAATRMALRSPAGQIEVQLRVLGLHNARNALAAAAATLAAGVSLEAIRDGLQGFQGVRGRLQVRAAMSGATLIDDSYNANPDSSRAAIDVLAATPGRKILVFGDMGEVGEAAGQFHDEIGGYAKSQGVDVLFSLGEHAEVTAHNFGSGGQHFESVEELVAALLPQLEAQTVVLVKGSRFMHMERVVDAISV